MVGELGEQRSEARKQLIVYEKYKTPGIRGADNVKGSQTERADRKQFSETEILKLKFSEGKQL